MATLREYFDTDFKHVLSSHQTKHIRSEDDQIDLEVVARVHLDFNASVKYISYFLPKTKYVFNISCILIKNPNLALAATNSLFVKSGFVGEEGVDSTELKFSGRIFVYSETDLSKKERDSLNSLAKEEGIALIFRGPKYAKDRSALEKPLAFISHDSQDKDEVARPLALELSRMMCPVWYDEFSLKVGDNLRESIEKGIKECKKCILVISPNFISNEAWTKKEFNSIFTRELIEKDNVILPVWHKVSVEDVYDYSPSLANKFAVKWELGLKEVARRLYNAIMK